MALGLFKLLLFYLFTDATVFKHVYGLCSLNLDKRSTKNHPLILDANGDMIYPTENRKLVFGKRMFLFPFRT